MLLFVHIPKTAGTGFKTLLTTSCFKPEEVAVVGSLGWTETSTGLDITTNRDGLPGAVSVKPTSHIKMVAGHYVASHMVKRFSDATLVTWVRDPVQRLLSHYHYYIWMSNSDPWITNNDSKPNVVGRASNEEKMRLDYNLVTLEKYLKHPLTHNLMSRQLDIPLERFKFIGITEHFENDLIRFERVTGLQITKEGKGLKDNVNPKKKSPKEKYTVPDDVVELIKHYNREDFDLYDKCLQIAGYK